MAVSEASVNDNLGPDHAPGRRQDPLQRHAGLADRPRGQPHRAEHQPGGTSYGSADRLDPGQASSHRLDAEFPVAALKAKSLKEVRLEFSFIPSQFKEETLNFTVSIGGQ